MKKILLPIIGSLLVCLGMLFFVVFNQDTLGIGFMCVGILLQVINIFSVLEYLKNKKNETNSYNRDGNKY